MSTPKPKEPWTPERGKHTPLTGAEVSQLLADAHQLQAWERSILPKDEGSYRPAEPGEDSREEDMACPLCDGGYVDGQRYDAKAVLPATLVGYGIGDGLRTAERWAENSVAGVLHLASEVAALKAELAHTKTVRAAGCQCSDDDACKFARDRDSLLIQRQGLREELSDTQSSLRGARQDADEFRAQAEALRAVAQRLVAHMEGTEEEPKGYWRVMLNEARAALAGTEGK